MLSTLLLLLMLLICLSFSFFFSGIETGIVSLDKLRLEKEAKHNTGKKRLLHFIESPDRFFGTTLVGNNLINILIASVATYILQERLPSSVDPKVSALILTGIILIFGEIVPKAIFRDYPNKLVPLLFPVLRFFYVILKPLVLTVTSFNSLVFSLFRVKQTPGFSYITKDDLAFILSQTSEDEDLAEPQRNMLEDALEFNEQKAKNIMIPRMEVVAMPDDTPLPEVETLARENGYTRYPVYHENLDHIVGVLIIYDIIKNDNIENKTARDIMHVPYFAPETIDIDSLMKEMQIHKKSMAIISDSFGGTSGIVTMEDILEEIVGDIEDEYDIEDDSSRDISKIGNNLYIVNGDVEIDRLADEYELELPHGNYTTVAGLIIDQMEKIPIQGQYIDLDNCRMQILQVTKKKIVKVKIKVNSPSLPE
ncbi:MAG TPA: hemolysin family protein [Candidatus Cloacimonadota bacterium]|mgnify:CR=1 FL=1|nr:hemolysin family protein [Candidatus Cloacimonadota bacterium]HPT71406.1 hemolysin family protein [Candidatus Cloacimonadota bacterium]